MGEGRLMAEVKKGDTISTIAAKNKVSVAAIAAANPQIKNLNKISVGQNIVIPKVSTSVKTSGSTYAGGVTGGANPFASGSGVNTTTLAGINKASGFTGATDSTKTPDVKTPVDPKDPDEEDKTRVIKTPVLDSNGKVIGYNVTVYNADGSIASSTFEAATGSEDKKDDNERRDAFAFIRKTMLTYGFTEAEMKEIDSYISGVLTNPRIGPEQALIDMRGLAAYKARFAGNEARVKAGLNAYSEADYLRQEDSYAQYLKAGGVESLGSRALYSKLIGGAVAPDEVGKRINLAVARVQNSDPEIKRQLQKFYPSITDKDMVGYFLSPETALPELQKKTTAAEIGAVAFNQGLNRSLAADDIEIYRKSAEDLAAYGIDRAAAMEGYANIATVLPTSQKLSSIYKESDINYTQQTAESEFLKSNADAAEKRRQLKALETAAFSGGSGTSKVSFASQARGAGQI
jgi:murein DD-endopeptidase MepM/ murein hydrolase activator NlpD